MLEFIKRYTLKYWPYYLSGLVALIITNYIATVIPLKIQLAIDLLVQKQPFMGIKQTLISIIGLAIILAISRTLSRVLIFIPGRKVEYDLRNDLFEHLLSLSASYYRSEKVGDLMSRMINDLQSLRATAALGYLHIINTIMIYTIVIIQMMRINPSLTFWIVIPIPLMMLFIGTFVKHMYKSIAACQKELGEITNFFIEMLSNIKIIKTAVAENAIISQFHERNQSYYEKNIRLAKIRSGMFPFIGIIGSIGHLILLLVGGKLIIEGSLTIGQFVALGSYIALLAWPTASLAWIINIIQRGKVSWERIYAILNTESDFVGATLISTDQTPVVSLSNLSFSYDKTTTPSIQNLSLRIQPGQIIGFFGPSGSGKSTIARILAGLEHPDPKMMLINDTCIQDCDIDSYRQHVSYVSQQAFLFSASVLENITFHPTVDTLENVKSVTQSACLDKDIQRFQDTYKTPVGEKGVILSGGQKSRLALARAFYKNNRILILDDVLSAVDHDTEQLMIANILKRKQAQQTVVLISHRISALTDCDTIYVLNEGKLIDEGTHEELTAKEGLYKHTYQYQKMFETL